jgi:hypothetical protein
MCTFIGIFSDGKGSSYHVERHTLNRLFYIVERETGNQMAFDSLPKSWVKIEG